MLRILPDYTINYAAKSFDIISYQLKMEHCKPSFGNYLHDRGEISLYPNYIYFVVTAAVSWV